MKLLLHIGMAKSGSTAIQNCLAASHDGLLDRGVLYPVGHRLGGNHNFLVTGFLENPDLPRLLRTRYASKPDEQASDFAEHFEGIERAVSRHSPELLILSAEYLFRPYTPTELNRLVQYLSRLTEDVSVVAFVRSPVGYYLSFAQQQVKASSVVPAPFPVTYRAEIEAFRKAFGDVRVMPFVRSAFPDGDIVRALLDPIDPNLAAATVASRDENVSLTAEGMEIMRRHRAVIYPDREDAFMPASRKLRLSLEAILAEHPASRRPTLHADVADYIRRASTDVIWLRDKEGIVFEDIDYAQVGRDVPVPTAQPLEVSDICPLDRDLLRELEYRLMHSLNRDRKSGPPKGSGSKVSS